MGLGKGELVVLGFLTVKRVEWSTGYWQFADILFGSLLHLLIGLSISV
jgi:hypothetical protein